MRDVGIHYIKMKKNSRNVLLGIGILLIVFLIYLLPGYLSIQKYKKDNRKIASILIYQEESIIGLKEIEFRICDSTYSFDIEEVQDTIFDNFMISDEEFPCSVNVVYEFDNGNKELHEVESYNCSGCSGINIYAIIKDKIKYQYHP